MAAMRRDAPLSSLLTKLAAAVFRCDQLSSVADRRFEKVTNARMKVK
jgi:hypothetical protein